jgi:hypothetical protein
MIYPGSRRSSLFSKILGKVEKKLYQKPLKRSIDDLIIFSAGIDIQKEKNYSRLKAVNALNSELNLIQLH